MPYYHILASQTTLNRKYSGAQFEPGGGPFSTRAGNPRSLLALSNENDT